jgi:hypothetical protein
VDAVRRVILFILGIACLIGSLAEDPIHIWSMVVGLLLMGVITWDQLAHTFRRYDEQERLAHDDER